jgi:hypothetical protein
VCTAISPFLILRLEENRLSSSADVASVESFLGSARETYRDSSAITRRFGHWDFHEVKTGEVTYTPDLPDVADRVSLYRGHLGIFTEYLVYIRGDDVSAIYFVGYN